MHIINYTSIIPTMTEAEAEGIEGLTEKGLEDVGISLEALREEAQVARRVHLTEELSHTRVQQHL